MRTIVIPTAKVPMVINYDNNNINNNGGNHADAASLLKRPEAQPQLLGPGGLSNGRLQWRRGGPPLIVRAFGTSKECMAKVGGKSVDCANTFKHVYP